MRTFYVALIRRCRVRHIVICFKGLRSSGRSPRLEAYSVMSWNMRWSVFLTGRSRNDHALQCQQIQAQAVMTVWVQVVVYFLFGRVGSQWHCGAHVAILKLRICIMYFRKPSCYFLLHLWRIVTSYLSYSATSTNCWHDNNVPYVTLYSRVQEHHWRIRAVWLVAF